MIDIYFNIYSLKNVDSTEYVILLFTHMMVLTQRSANVKLTVRNAREENKPLAPASDFLFFTLQ